MATFVPAYKPDAILLGQQAFTVDPLKGILAVSSKVKYDEKNTRKVVALFIKKLSEMHSAGTQMPDPERIRIIQAADLCLKTLTDKHKDKLGKGLTECKSDKFLMSLAKLDRYVAANKFGTLSSANPIPAEKVAVLYRTQVAKDMLSKWVLETTHAGHKSGSASLEHRVVSSDRAAEAYFLRPEEVDFISESYTHKQIGRLNEHIEIDPETMHHRIRFEGGWETVETVSKRLSIEGKGKLYSTDGEHKRYFYCQDQGLREFDPENWKELPVYRERKYARSDEDYRLVIKTIINDKDDDKHSWIELKTPTAVYNVGYFWDDRDSISTTSLCKTLRGKLHAVDKNELLGKESCIQKTVSSITKEQFEALKRKIEAFQNKPQPKMFNLISSSCSSWTREIVSEVGLTMSAKENGTRVVTGKRFEFKHSETTILGKLERVWHRFLAVMRNVLIYVLGGFKAVLPRKEFDTADLAFRSFAEVFNPNKGLFDYPKRIREWQDAVASLRKHQEELVRQTSGFEVLEEEAKQKLIDQVRYALPVGVSLPDPAVTF